jgi:ATP-dependent DNA helicase DinG
MPSPAAAPAMLADLPVLVARANGALWLEPGGEVIELDHAAAALRAEAVRPLLCHAPAIAARLGIARFAAFDLLDLYAFVRPAGFCLPTVRGLAEALGLPRPRDTAGEALTLIAAARALFDELARRDGRDRRQAGALATTMARAGWPWGPLLAAALADAAPAAGGLGGLDVWNRLPEWSETAPPPPPDQVPVSGAEARARLAELLGAGAEARPQQADYAAAVAAAFAPRDRAGAPNMVLGEAGTGVGKTLGYIAPASLWAEKNGAAVWLSTFTKNLQRQIDQELDRLYPDPQLKAARVVVRKGRENYLCLLNMQEAAQGGAARPVDLVALGLLARWALATRDGDMVGGDFPAWLVELHGPARTVALADQRGECIYSACPHYRRCFIERAVRRARRADIVIANHALVMHQAALAGDAAELPSRYVFDEGHHVFDAADSTFSAHLSGAEGAELRRWIRGPEGGRRTRARGLENRIGDLVADEEGSETLKAALRAATALPAEGWPQRVTAGQPAGQAETFLALLRQQVYARAKDADSAYGIECPTREPVTGLLDAAATLARALADLAAPLQALMQGLARRLEDEADSLDTPARLRIEAAARGLQRRLLMLAAWRAMLDDLAREAPPAFVDWFAVERDGGRDVDVAFRRHWLDPTVPFAEAVLKPAHGVVVTSATLRDRGGDSDADWQAAEARTGARHLPLPAQRVSLPSPFDYAGRTRVFVVTDVRRDHVGQVAAAYRELFLAAGGGGLGLFTAIWRLRAVHKRIAAPLEAAGLPLYAQHVDPIDTATLVDIFRAESDSCLLGTDAVRDGVDVPGRSLRLIVFDRVPWPRPDILHRARRAAAGGQAYDDMITRLRLKQAFGRLLRRADDAGVFVMLDAMLPSRLLGAFPAEVEVRRVGLAEAIAGTRDFLASISAAA